MCPRMPQCGPLELGRHVHDAHVGSRVCIEMIWRLLAQSLSSPSPDLKFCTDQSRHWKHSLSVSGHLPLICGRCLLSRNKGAWNELSSGPKTGPEVATNDNAKDVKSHVKVLAVGARSSGKKYE
ncbi:unnamed protein product [Ixodes pacificus]